jgi:hypothetical protein
MAKMFFLIIAAAFLQGTFAQTCGSNAPPTGGSCSFPSYSTGGGNSVNVVMNVCPGQQIEFSTCATTSTDTLLRLARADGTVIKSNDDATGCGLRSKIVHTFDLPCQMYTIQQACYSSNNCAATTDVTNLSPGDPPTFRPTEKAIIPPIPELFPFYSVPTSTAFTACDGMSATFTVCSGEGGTCIGDTILSVTDAETGAQIAENDDSCGLCSKLNTVTFQGACKLYNLNQMCYGSSSCSSQVKSIVDYGGWETEPPVSTPVANPTGVPIANPTNAPIANPTNAPIANPTNAPIANPTNAPIANPTNAPIANPTNAPIGSPDECPAFTSTAGTWITCSINICPGEILTFATCNADMKSCDGDTFLKLHDAAGTEVAHNDDRCGYCSALDYEYQGTVCAPYNLMQGCFEGSCGGVTKITRTDAAVVSKTGGSLLYEEN